MKKLAFLIAMLLASVGAFAQSSNICFDTVFTTTGRKQLPVPGGVTGTADRYSSETFAYKLAGSPASVSITVEASDYPLPTVPATIISAVTTTTNNTNIPLGQENLTYRYWYANLGTFDTGTGKSLTVTSCMAAQAVPGGTAGAVSWSNLTAPTGDLTLNFAAKNTTFTNAGNFGYLGKLGIGTSSPSHDFHVLSTTNAGSVLFESTGTDSASIIDFKNTGVQGPSIDFWSAGRRWAWMNSQAGAFTLRDSAVGTDPVNGTTQLTVAPTTGNVTLSGGLTVNDTAVVLQGENSNDTLTLTGATNTLPTGRFIAATGAAGSPLRYAVNIDGSTSQAGRAGMGTVHFAARGAVVPGVIFWCDDCDPETVAGVANECTSSGAKTGALAIGGHTKWMCNDGD